MRVFLIAGLLGALLAGCNKLAPPSLEASYEEGFLKIVSKENEPIVIQSVVINHRFIPFQIFKFEGRSKKRIDSIQNALADMVPTENFDAQSNRYEWASDYIEYSYKGSFPLFVVPVIKREEFNRTFKLAPTSFLGENAPLFVGDTLKFGGTQLYGLFLGNIIDPNTKEAFNGELLTVEVQTNRGVAFFDFGEAE